jgi:hypothetical protein
MCADRKSWALVRWPEQWPYSDVSENIGLRRMGDIVDLNRAASSSLCRVGLLLIAILALFFGAHGHSMATKPVSHAAFCSSSVIAQTSTLSSSIIEHGGGPQ